ncbi:MAG: iron-molybdenum cofactor biosynthesis protein [Bacteroidales bacterium]|nr:iron-molybdenum cofactor biosynthesis protein [Bacteroidales bacterium]
MKIAIPTDDKESICPHFGRTSGFMIFKIEDRNVVESEYRQNTFTGHAQGHHNDHHHSHSGIFQALGDCQIVIAKGMGRRLYNDFEEWKIQVFITKENNIDEAVDAFINNTLDSDIERLCKE